MAEDNKHLAPQQKEVIQSYILTAAKYDYTVYEKRILYKLVELAQDQLQGQHLRGRINHNLWGFVDIELPIADILIDEADNHHNRIKGALLSMTKKTIIYEDSKVWQAFNLIISPKIAKYKGTLAFTLDPKIWNCILDFSRGYRKLELQTAMQFKSTYAMRFYELLSGQRTPLTFAIDKLKDMFGIVGKYHRPNLFIKYVVEAAKKELDKCSPVTFDYEVNKVGRKVISVSFFPVEQPQFKSDEVEKQDLNRKVNLSWDIDRSVLNYLRDSLGFTNTEIKNNRQLFIEAQQLPDLLLLLSDLKARARATDIANPKGYIINALRNQLNEQQQGKN